MGAAKLKNLRSIIKQLMRRLYFITSILFSALSLLACTRSGDDGDCISFKRAPVEKVEGPATGLVNQEIKLNVVFRCACTSGQLDRFEKSTNGDTTTVNVIARYAGCTCLTAAPLQQAVYTFKATEARTYYLKFGAYEHYLTHVITVQ